MKAFFPSVLWALTWLAIFLLVPQTSACDWQAEVRGDLAKEATYFHPDDTSPLHIRLHNPHEGISVLHYQTLFQRGDFSLNLLNL
jgi:hypothetical protein